MGVNTIETLTPITRINTNAHYTIKYYTFITRTSERLSPINYCFCPSSRINAPKSFAITSAFNSESVN